MERRIGLCSVVVLVGLWMMGVGLRAGAPAAPASAPAKLPPEKATLAELYVAYSEPAQCMFAVNNSVVFKDVAALRRYIAGLPEGSTITWAPRDVIMGGEQLRTQKDLDAFKKFCEEKRVTLIILPGG
jgi:hypothetical protein